MELWNFRWAFKSRQVRQLLPSIKKTDRALRFSQAVGGVGVRESAALPAFGSRLGWVFVIYSALVPFSSPCVLLEG